MKLNKYPDGTSYVNNTEKHQILFRLNSYEDLWHLNQYVDAFHSEQNGKVIPEIYIPNLIDAQADRRFNQGESFGLKLVCKFLNSLNATYKIFHPHNTEVVEALLDRVQVIDNSRYITEVLKQINSEDLVLLSPDAGMFKPLMKLCDKIKWEGQTYSASKARKYENGESKLIQEVDKKDFEGRDILIVDDICVNGGTFIGLAKILKEKNCGKLYLAVSHMTVKSPNPALFEAFNCVFTTNSKFDEYLAPKNKLKVLRMF